jgi:hypothetical protein
MVGVYTTSRGNKVDMNNIKIKNEMVVAVGNAGTNARGDLVKGGQIIKTREQIMREQYSIRGNNIPKDSTGYESLADIKADEPTPVNFESPYDSLKNNNNEALKIAEQPLLDNVPRGGLASAVSKSQEIAEVLEQQRKRI